MLLKFGARNCFSFKEGIEISFELGKKCPEEVSRGRNVTNLLCVKGANGSGKTNVLKIISFLRDFCRDSFNRKPEESLFIYSFFHNNDPIDLFCEMEIDGVRYRYETSLTKDEVLEETLLRKKKRFTEVFKRVGNKIKYCINEYDDLKTMKLRTNASFISTAHQYDSKSSAPIYNFFNFFLSNVIWIGRYEFSTDYRETSKLYYTSPEVFEFAKKIIGKCDLGIKKIRLFSTEDEKGKKYYFPDFEHRANIKNNKLGYHFQSSGTKALYNDLPYYDCVLRNGGILVMDEFDINFHPHILKHLVGMFDDKELNPKNAQMIFTTHNADIMDDMSKYRTVLIEQKDSESFGYRLDEITGDLIRNDRPISPIYNAGKIGGVPKI